MSNATGSDFNESYYTANCQLRDRPALWFYERLAKSFFPPGRVLDFGCGTGYFLKRLSKHFTVDGYDISPYSLDSTRTIVPDANIFQNLESIPERTYSGITALHVLEHIGDNELHEIMYLWRKALVSGGRVLCVTPDPSGRGHIIKDKEWFGFRDPTHINLKPRQEWEKYFAQYKFETIKIGTDGLWDFPYTRGIPKPLDALIHSKATAIQFLLGRLILPAGKGESAIFLLQLNSDSP